MNVKDFVNLTNADERVNFYESNVDGYSLKGALKKPQALDIMCDEILDSTVVSVWTNLDGVLCICYNL